jgi:hypothetical protein
VLEEEKEGRGCPAGRRPPAAVAQIREEGPAAGLLNTLAAAAASLTGRRAHRPWPPSGQHSEGEGVNELGFHSPSPVRLIYVPAPAQRAVSRRIRADGCDVGGVRGCYLGRIHQPACPLVFGPRAHLAFSPLH